MRDGVVVVGRLGGWGFRQIRSLGAESQVIMLAKKQDEAVAPKMFLNIHEF